MMVCMNCYQKNSILLFGDAASDEIGRIDYDHNDNSLDFVTNNSTALTIDSSQNATFAGRITANDEHHYFQNTGGNANVYIKASNSGNSRLYFGDVADVGAGFIDYDHGTSMALGTEGTTALTIDSSQNATFAGELRVNGGQASIYGAEGADAILELNSDEPSEVVVICIP